MFTVSSLHFVFFVVLFCVERDSVNSERFWWRTCSSTNSELKMQKLSISEILSGTKECRGLLPIIESYLEVMGCSGQTLQTVHEYLDLIKQRAAGTVWTNAKWLRHFVQSHPQYKRDSTLSMEICRDLVDARQRIIRGEVHDKRLLGDKVRIKDRYYRRMPLKYMCNPSTSPKLLSKL